MSIICVSSAGSNTAPYETFAKAFTTYAAAFAYVSTGDDIKVLYTHSESPGALFEHTLVSDLTISSVNSDFEYTRGASILNSGFDIEFITNKLVINGMDFVCSNFRGETANNNLKLVDCTVDMSSGTNGSLRLGGSAVQFVAIDCTFECSLDTGTLPFVFTNDGFVHFRNCTFLLAAGSSCSRSFINIASGHDITYLIEFCNLSEFNTTDELVKAASATYGSRFIKFYRCALPSGLTGIISAESIITSKDVIELIACTKTDYSGSGDDSGTNAYYQKLDSSKGYIDFDSTSYLDSSYSVSISTDRNSVEDYLMHKIAEFPAKDLTVSKTIKVRFSSDTVLSDSMVWISIGNPNSTLLSLGAITDNRVTDIFSSGATHTTSSETWTGAGTYKYESSIVLPALTGGSISTLDLYINIAEPAIVVWIEPLPVITDT